MADPKPHLDPSARRGQPHSQFWYELSVNDPEGFKVLEDIVIAEHKKPITTLGEHAEHVDEGPPNPINAACKGMFLGFPFGMFCGIAMLGWSPDMLTMTKKGPILTLPTTAYLMRTTFIPALYMGTVGSTYLGIKALSYTIREKKDQWNAIYAGFATGLVMGSVMKRVDRAFMTGLGVSFVAGVGDYYKRNAGSLFSWDKEDALQRHWGVRPYQYRESEELKALKEKYPQHRNL